MTSRNARLSRSLLAGVGASALALSLAACSSSDSTPDGGGSAVCDQSTMEGLGQSAAGSGYVSFNSYQCEDGFALVSVVTSDGGVEQTQVYLFQAEGANWALQQRDAVCADGGGEGVPSDLRDTLCALR
jgi:hypothetical protein